MAMEITANQHSDVYVVAIEGRIDTQGAFEMDATLQRATKSGQHKMVLDMAKVRYISSNGLRTMADVLTQNKDAGGDLKLVSVNSKVMRVLQIVGFDKFFSIYDTLDEAVQAFDETP
jgi:anti-anti-sigma factor